MRRVSKMGVVKGSGQLRILLLCLPHQFVQARRRSHVLGDARVFRAGSNAPHFPSADLCGLLHDRHAF